MMDFNPLTYSKDNGLREVISKTPKQVDIEKLPEIGGLGAIDTNYTKGEPLVETTIIFILSGGEEREKNYFKPLKSDNQIHNVKIAFRSKEGQGLKPYELLSIASDFVKNQKFITEDEICYNIEEGDVIYLIQDVDEFEAELKNHLKANYDKSKLQWIISNPCFEIWLFYHYNNNPSVLKECLNKSTRDRSNWLKENLHVIIPGGVKTTKAFHSSDIAIVNSRTNYSEQDNFPDIFSTQMHIVAEKIINSLKEEYKELNERRQRQIDFYKKLNHKIDSKEE